MEVIPKGAMAKVTQAHDAGEDKIVSDGTLFVVYDYVSSADSEDGQAYYVGHGNGGWCNVTALAAHVEQVLTPKEVASRKPPTKNKLANALISSVLGSYGSFSIHMGGPAYDDEVEFEGTTSTGLEFGFTIKITDVGEIEL